ncbi:MULTISPECIES: hypothetical protein [Bradyrhizobium]|uniref:hypothetical protein n=1 Tax=Bradyrhizobium TaxID=374 RepID=UPI000577B13B|nr:hypothetical protein [Bradyrhizobium sp. CCBAU 15544]
MLAGRYPKAYASLLGRLIPLQLDGAINSVSEVRIVSVPSGHHLGAEAIAGMSALSDTPLDHDGDAQDTLIEAASDVDQFGSVDDTVEHSEAKARGRAIVRSLLKPIAGS